MKNQFFFVEGSSGYLIVDKTCFECRVCSKFHFYGAHSDADLRQIVPAMDMFDGALYDLGRCIS